MDKWKNTLFSVTAPKSKWLNNKDVFIAYTYILSVDIPIYPLDDFTPSGDSETQISSVRLFHHLTVFNFQT